jgi:hypothetical protein
MLPPMDGFSVDKAHGFEQSVAVQEAPIESGDDRVFLGDDVAIQKDEHARGLAKKRRFGEKKVWQRSGNIGNTGERMRFWHADVDGCQESCCLGQGFVVFRFRAGISNDTRAHIEMDDALFAQSRADDDA